MLLVTIYTLFIHNKSLCNFLQHMFICNFHIVNVCVLPKFCKITYTHLLLEHLCFQFVFSLSKSPDIDLKPQTTACLMRFFSHITQLDNVRYPKHLPTDQPINTLNSLFCEVQALTAHFMYGFIDFNCISEWNEKKYCRLIL